MGALALALSGADLVEPEGGHLQVRAGVGVEIEVAERQATAEDEYGVTFLELRPGAHRLIARREGYVDQHALIRVRRGEVTVHRLAPWRKRVTNSGRAAIIVQTLPVDATVSAQTLGYRKALKSDEDFVIPQVPAGRHKLTFCNDYKCIDYHATVEDGELLKLLVLFDPGEVEDRSVPFRAHLASISKACLRTRALAACNEACTLATQLQLPSVTCRVNPAATDIADVPEDDGVIPASTRRALP